MKLFKLFLAAFLVSLAGSGFAQTADTSTQTADSDGWFKSHYNAAESTVENLYDNGRLSMILSGYAYHDRRTYSESHLDHINEKAWGLGMSKELRDDKDNEESIQFMVIADSHYEPQINLSYSYQWMKPIGGNWEVGAGFNAGLVSRQDIFSGIPIPAILPDVSIGSRDTKLIMTFVPHLSGTVNGNVLFVALRVSLK
jgi:lipid IVA palmitoyltransferase